jgi:DNA-binding LacI/PurR family transcriptional regulator
VNFLRDRAEQLADYMRGCISRGELVDPLPTTREWSERLGVSRPTLRKALRELQREGLIAIRPRGVHIQSPQAEKQKHPNRLVRLLYYGPDLPEISHCMVWVAPLSERLHRHRIQIVVERCNGARLRAIVNEPHHVGELLFLLGMRMEFHRLIARTGKPAVVLGEPTPDVPLPFITDDQDAAVRHAALTLLRQGFDTLSLLVPSVTSPGIPRATESFRTACARWPHQPVFCHVRPMPLEPGQLERAVRQFAALFRGRQGVVVIGPLPVTLVMTALLARGIAIPKQAELAAILHNRDEVRVTPRPLHYPPPIRRSVREMADVAIHFFETGIVPDVQKRLPVELVRGEQTR